MRKLPALLLGIAFVTVVLAAQTHDNQDERMAKDSITLTADLKVGTTVLAPDDYGVMCDTKTITFTRKSDNKKALEVTCKGTLMPKKAESSVLHTTTDRSGVRVLDKFFLRGSNVEHVFK